MADLNPTVTDDTIEPLTITVTKKPTQWTDEDFEPNRLNAMGVALTEDNLIGTTVNFLDDAIGGMSYDYDPDFDINDYKDVYRDIDPAYWDELAGAKSLPHLKHLAREYGNYSKSSEYLDSLGVEGMAYRFASVLGDVPLISALQKIRTVGKAGAILDKLNDSYAGRVLIAGTIEGSFEGVKQITSPKDRDELDLLMAVGLGGIVGGIYNPRAFDKETAESLTTITREAIDEVGTTGQLGERTKAAVEDKQFNMTSAFKESDSPTMQQFGDQLFNDVLNPSLDDFKAIETRDQVHQSMTNAFNMNFQPLYLEWFKNQSSYKLPFVNPVMARFNAQAQDEFYDMVGDMIQGRHNPMLDELDDAFIKKLENATKQMSHDSHDIMYKAGHPKFTSGEIPKADDYMPIRWNRSKIRQSSDEGIFKKAEFRKAVINGLEKKFRALGIVRTDDEIEEIAKKFTDTMYQDDAVKGVDGFIEKAKVMKSATDELAEMMGLTDDELETLRQMMRDSDQAAERGTASATKRRTPLDLDGRFVTDEGFEIVLADYLDGNIQRMWASYAHSMSGDTALRGLGINSRTELAELTKKVAQEIDEAVGLSSASGKAQMANFESAIAHLLGVSSKHAPDDDLWKVVRTMNNLTRAAKLGATWFAMSVEAARIAHRVGFKNLYRSFPQLKQMRKAYLTGQGDVVYREMQLHEALGGELNELVSLAKYEDQLSAGAQGRRTWLDRLERFSDVANEATMLAGGVKSGTAILEYWHSISARVKMMDMARKGLDDAAYDFFAKYGFDRDLADEIAGQINKFGSKDLNEPLLNLDKWENGLGQKWSLGVRRQSYELVQRANLGDQVAGRMLTGNKMLQDTLLGSLAGNLKGYMLVAYNKQLSKGIVDIARGGKDMMDTFGNWTYQTVFAATAYMAKQYTQYGNDPEKLEENLSLERIALGTFSMTTFATFLPALADTATDVLMDEKYFNQYSRGGMALPIAPVQYGLDVVQSAKTAGKMISPWAEASEGEVKKLLGTLPLSNAIGVKMLTTELAEAIAGDTSGKYSGW